MMKLSLSISNKSDRPTVDEVDQFLDRYYEGATQEECERMVSFATYALIELYPESVIDAVVDIHETADDCTLVAYHRAEDLPALTDDENAIAFQAFMSMIEESAREMAEAVAHAFFETMPDDAARAAMAETNAEITP
jgi:hypothetical protein